MVFADDVRLTYWLRNEVCIDKRFFPVKITSAPVVNLRKFITPCFVFAKLNAVVPITFVRHNESVLYLQICHRARNHRRPVCRRSRPRSCRCRCHIQQLLTRTSHHRLREDRPSVRPASLDPLLFKLLLFTASVAILLSVILCSRLVRRLSTSETCRRSGCRGASATGLAISRRVLSRFLDLLLRVVRQHYAIILAVSCELTK